MTKFVLQAATTENHLTIVKEALSVDEVEQAIIGTAFMTEGGVSLIEKELRAISSKVTLIVGIRNGITTAQGIEMAIDIGCKVIAVDTGTRGRIFHPKIYYIKTAMELYLITPHKSNMDDAKRRTYMGSS